MFPALKQRAEFGAALELALNCATGDGRVKAAMHSSGERQEVPQTSAVTPIFPEQGRGRQEVESLSAGAATSGLGRGPTRSQAVRLFCFTYGSCLPTPGTRDSMCPCYN